MLLLDDDVELTGSGHIGAGPAGQRRIQVQSPALVFKIGFPSRILRESRRNDFRELQLVAQRIVRRVTIEGKKAAVLRYRWMESDTADVVVLLRLPDVVSNLAKQARAKES